MTRLSLIIGLAVILCAMGLSPAFSADGPAAPAQAAASGAASNPGQGHDPFALTPAGFAAQGTGQFTAAAGFAGDNASKAKRCDNGGNAQEHNKHCE